ncbi:uncharacterized protein METZ01_LOCUS498439, partial [marine metagenome]
HRGLLGRRRHRRLADGRRVDQPWTGRHDLPPDGHAPRHRHDRRTPADAVRLDVRRRLRPGDHPIL